MAVEIRDQTEDTYWIARKNDNSIIHYGLVEVGDVMESGLDILETFLIEAEWLARLAELGITPE
jgi:hypothetical protein